MLFACVIVITIVVNGRVNVVYGSAFLVRVLL